MDWTSIAIASLPGLASLLTVLVQARKDKKTVEATATDIITKAAAQAVELARKDAEGWMAKAEKCEGRLAMLEQTTRDQQTAIDRLRQQVKDLGAVPANGTKPATSGA